MGKAVMITLIASKSSGKIVKIKQAHMGVNDSVAQGILFLSLLSL